MPKPVSQLQGKQRPLAEQVIEFLQNDPENAYAAEEIAAKVTGGGHERVSLTELLLRMAPEEKRAQALAPWVRTLAELEMMGRVRSFHDGASTYYAYAAQP